MRSLSRFLPLLVAIFCILARVAERPAHADASAESQARALQKKAMTEDYLTVDFDRAIERLSTAIVKCGTGKCSPGLRASLRRDLATVYSASGKKDDALSTMTEAVQLDPALAIDPNYKTKELEALLVMAKKLAGVSASGRATPPVGNGGGADHGPATAANAPGTESTPSSDFTHVPATEQVQKTPLPVYVEYGGTETIAKVVLRYKGYGMADYKTLEMHKVGNGWGTLLPCADSILGETQYYVQGLNTNNDPVAVGGDRNNPYKVLIKAQISGAPPHLPDQAPPAQCADTGDCPPDFPGGCGKKGDKQTGQEPGKSDGEACVEDAQCASSNCVNDKCTAVPEEKSKGSATRRKLFWVGLDVWTEVPFVHSANDVCLLNQSGLPVNTAGYYCTNGSQNFPLRAADGDRSGTQNLQIYPGAGEDLVHGGGTFGNVPVTVSFDWAYWNNLMLGVRLGFVLNRYSGSAAGNDGVGFHVPIFFEARATYLFGEDPIGMGGLAPYVYGGLGFGEMDAPIGVTVRMCSPSASNCTSNANAQVTAWEMGGPGEIAVGGGLRYGLPGTKESPARYAMLVGARLMAGFGAGLLIAPAPEVSAQVGF